MLNTEPSSATLWKVRSTAGGMAGSTPSAPPAACERAISSTVNGSPALAAQICSTTSGARSGYRSDQPPGRGPVQRCELDPGPRAPRDQAVAHRAHRLTGRLTVREGQQHGFGDGDPGQVVQQPQGRVVGLVEVVDDQQQPVPARGQPDQLGRGDEQPLVAGLAAPGHVPPGQRPFDLLPVGVVQPVEQRRVPTAQAAERLQHR